MSAIHNTPSEFAGKYLDLSKFLGRVVKKEAVGKPQYSEDNYFRGLLSQAGIDVDALEKEYSLTPISNESVYKDFSKYHADLDLSHVKWDELEVGARWLVRHKLFVLDDYSPKILSYDQVLDMLDKTKSATALWNEVYKNKTEVLCDPDWEISFVKFLSAFAKGENITTLFVAIQKEEIRPTDKIEDLKFRSIIIGALYTLITGHMLYGDIDDKIATKWLDNGSGIGMSFFFRQYDDKMTRFDGKQAYAFSDVGKYDSRQAAHLQYLAAQANSVVFSDVYDNVSFYTLLGSLSKVATDLGIADFPVNTAYLRNRLIEHGTFGPIRLPGGEFFYTITGEKSGNHRTGHSNTDRYKIVEFAAASRFFKTYEDYCDAGYETDQTGDDMIHGGPDFRVHDAMNEIWKSLGCDVEAHVVSDVTELEYLGSRPIVVRYLGNEFFVPYCNSSKVVAGLADKFSVRSDEVDINRLVSALVICFWTDDKPYIRRVIELYKNDHPHLKDDKRWLTDEQIIHFYLGYPESEELGLATKFDNQWVARYESGNSLDSCFDFFSSISQYSVPGLNIEKPNKRMSSNDILQVFGKSICCARVDRFTFDNTYRIDPTARTLIQNHCTQNGIPFSCDSVRTGGPDNCALFAAYAAVDDYYGVYVVGASSKTCATNFVCTKLYTWCLVNGFQRRDKSRLAPNVPSNVSVNLSDVALNVLKPGDVLPIDRYSQDGMPDINLPWEDVPPFQELAQRIQKYPDARFIRVNDAVFLFDDMRHYYSNLKSDYDDLMRAHASLTSDYQNAMQVNDILGKQIQEISSNFRLVSAAIGDSASSWSAFLKAAWNKLMHSINGNSVSSFSLSKQKQHNRTMHSQNGNMEQRPRPVRKRQSIKKEVKTEAKKEVAKILKTKSVVMGRSGRPSRAAIANQIPIKSIRASVSASTRNAMKMALSLALPFNFKPQRWASQYSVAPTAVCNPLSVATVPWSGGTLNTANSQLSADEYVCFLFRNIERFFVQYDANPGNLSFNYNIYGNYNGGSTGEQPPTLSWTILDTAFNNTEVYLHTPYQMATTSYQPHSNMIYAGTDGGGIGRFFWYDKAENIALNYTWAPTSGSLAINTCLWDANEQTKIHNSVTLSPGTSVVANIAITQSGYYALTLTTLTEPSSLVNFVVNSLTRQGACSVFQHLPAPSSIANIPIAQGEKPLGVALLYTNLASELYKEGKIVTYQAPQGTYWYDDFISNTNCYTLIANAKGSSPRAVAKGAYTYLKPTQPEDSKVKVYTKSSGSVFYDSFWPLQNQSDYLAICANITVPQGQDAQIVYGFSGEYETTDQWRTLGKPDLTIEELNEALMIIKDAPQHFENPSHINDIVNDVIGGVTKFAKGFIKYAVPVAQAAADVAKIVGMVV